MLLMAPHVTSHSLFQCQLTLWLPAAPPPLGMFSGYSCRTARAGRTKELAWGPDLTTDSPTFLIPIDDGQQLQGELYAGSRCLLA